VALTPALSHGERESEGVWGKIAGMTATTADNVGFFGRFKYLAGDIKLSHSVLALPFALLAGFMAAGFGGRLPRVGEVCLVVACMVFARTSAMAVNRWADRDFDKANARTQGRAIPAGRLSAGFMLGGALVSGALFIAASAGFWLAYGNWWPVVLSPVVLLWLAGYSYTKRFTALCHLYLGVSLAMSPLAAAIAVNPAFLATPGPWLLALMVACWVAGFDVIYALQDVAVDKGLGLHSLPSKIGTGAALVVARVLHLVAVAALVGLWKVSGQLEVLFLIGVGLVTGLLALEHALVWRSETKHLNMAFFTVNGVISLVLGGLGVCDVVLGLWK
jgi:4-hydroxybenzoate polyprenyltransferase